MSRPRRHIPLTELLASALADKLPFTERDTLREQEAPASVVIRMFTADHIKLHCWDGSDKWWNLNMIRRGPELQAKDRADTSRAAKAVRIDAKWRSFMRKISKGQKPRSPRKPWPNRRRAKK